MGASTCRAMTCSGDRCGANAISLTRDKLAPGASGARSRTRVRRASHGITYERLRAARRRPLRRRVADHAYAAGGGAGMTTADRHRPAARGEGPRRCSIACRRGRARSSAPRRCRSGRAGSVRHGWPKRSRASSEASASADRTSLSSNAQPGGELFDRISRCPTSTRRRRRGRRPGPLEPSTCSISTASFTGDLKPENLLLGVRQLTTPR